ncbi:MAG: YrdB family protein [Bacteroidota bacterium]
MSKHPLNLALRFLLEIVALTVFAVWGRKAASGWWGVILAIGLPVFFAIVWGVFAVKDDPSRSGKTVISTKGIVRLILEILFFGLAALALFDLGFNIAGFAISILVLIHYVLSYDRVVWLLK